MKAFYYPKEQTWKERLTMIVYTLFGWTIQLDVVNKDKINL